jgi:hypothetical protein
MVTKRRTSLGEGCASRGTSEQLNAQLRLKPNEPSADDGLSDAETAGGRGDASRIGNFYKGS